MSITTNLADRTVTFENTENTVFIDADSVRSMILLRKKRLMRILTDNGTLDVHGVADTRLINAVQFMRAHAQQ